MTPRFLPFCLALLSGCASLPPPSPAAPMAPAAATESFALEGRLSVRQGETSHHVAIAWRHDAGSDEIFLTGPLGQGLARLTRDAGGARLEMADRQTIHAADWASLAERAFGAPLPVANLPRLLTAGDLATAEVDGWRVDVLDAAEGRPLLIEIRRGDTAVRLRIDQWLR